MPERGRERVGEKENFHSIKECDGWSVLNLGISFPVYRIPFGDVAKPECDVKILMNFDTFISNLFHHFCSHVVGLLEFYKKS